MPLILKSVVAQCYRGGRSIGSRQSVRHYCSPVDGVNGAGEKGLEWFIRRGFAVASGYFLGSVFVGDTAPEHEERRLEMKRISDVTYEVREKLVSELVEGARKKS